VRVTQVIGLPKSVGEIFGFIFSSSRCVTFDEIVQGTGISNGSASHGLRLLRRLGAIRVTFFARDRRDFYQAETSLQKLISGYLTQTVLCHMGGLTDRLHGLQAHVAEGDEGADSVLGERIKLLQSWNAQAGAAIAAALEALKK
jgi:DNA-binding transcriptional regulator GbsR (MarR family)